MNENPLQQVLLSEIELEQWVPSISRKQLINLFDRQNMKNGKIPLLLKLMGEYNGLEKALKTSIQRQNGLNNDQAIKKWRINKYSTNNIIIYNYNTYFELLMSVFTIDVIIKMVVFMVLVFAISQHRIAFVLMLILLILQSLVYSGLLYWDQQRNRFLNQQEYWSLKILKNQRSAVKIRGKWKFLYNRSILVGDIIKLQPGMIVPVSGIVTKCNKLRCQQIQYQFKKSYNSKNVYNTNQAGSYTYNADCLITAGSFVAEGDGQMMVLVVGLPSIIYYHPTTFLKINYIKQQLKSFQKRVSRIIQYLFFQRLFYVIIVLFGLMCYKTGFIDGIFWFFCYYLIIFVGLLLFVGGLMPTLFLYFGSLLYHHYKCKQFNICFNRQYKLSNSTHRITMVVSQQEFITQNHYQLINLWTPYVNINIPNDPLLEFVKSQLNIKFIDKMCNAICINTTVCPILQPNVKQPQADKNQCALLLFAHKLQYNYLQIRKNILIVKHQPTTQTRKITSTFIKTQKNYELFVMGKICDILPLCHKMLDTNGEAVQISEQIRIQISQMIQKFNENELNVTIGLCEKIIDIDENDHIDSEDIQEHQNNLTLIGLFTMGDPIKPNIKNTIRQLQQLKVKTVLVTCLSINQSISIGKKSGILGLDFDITKQQNCGVVISSNCFKNKLMQFGYDQQKYFENINNFNDFKQFITNIKIIANAGIQQKLLLVLSLKAARTRVATIGKTLRDAAYMLQANISLSYRNSQNQFIKQFSDAVILDNNFGSSKWYFIHSYKYCIYLMSIQHLLDQCYYLAYCKLIILIFLQINNLTDIIHLIFIISLITYILSMSFVISLACLQIQHKYEHIRRLWMRVYNKNIQRDICYFCIVLMIFLIGSTNFRYDTYEICKITIYCSILYQIFSFVTYLGASKQMSNSKLKSIMKVILMVIGIQILFQFLLYYANINGINKYLLFSQLNARTNFTCIVIAIFVRGWSTFTDLSQ